jgi:hypothetical protein
MTDQTMIFCSNLHQIKANFFVNEKKKREYNSLFSNASQINQPQV